MVGWHHRLNGNEFEQTLGDSEGQGSLECCSPWSHKESDISERLNNKYEAVEQIVKSLPRSTRKRDGPGEQRGSSSRECRLSPLRLHTMTFSSSWVSEREDDRRRSGFYWVCLLCAGTMLDTADTTSLTVQHHLQFSITYRSHKHHLQFSQSFVCVLVPQSCPTLCHPMGSNPPGSSVHGIFQTRILEWVAISFSRGSSQPRD